MYNNQKNYQDYTQNFKDNYRAIKKKIDNNNIKVYNNMSRYSEYINNKDNDNKLFHSDRSFAAAIDPKQVSRQYLFIL